jgi:hypothetical protein
MRTVFVCLLVGFLSILSFTVLAAEQSSFDFDGDEAWIEEVRFVPGTKKPRLTSKIVAAIKRTQEHELQPVLLTVTSIADDHRQQNRAEIEIQDLIEKINQPENIFFAGRNNRGKMFIYANKKGLHLLFPRGGKDAFREWPVHNQIIEVDFADPAIPPTAHLKLQKQFAEKLYRPDPKESDANIQGIYYLRPMPGALWIEDFSSLERHFQQAFISATRSEFRLRAEFLKTLSAHPGTIVRYNYELDQLNVIAHASVHRWILEAHGQSIIIGSTPAIPYAIEQNIYLPLWPENLRVTLPTCTGNL